MKITIEQLLQNLDKYKAGTKIELSGTIYTARDQAHKRLVELLNNGHVDQQHHQEWIFIHLQFYQMV